MKTRIVKYDNYIEIESDLEKGIFLNDWLTSEGYLSHISTDEIEISKDAKEYLQTNPQFDSVKMKRPDMLILRRNADGPGSTFTMGYGGPSRRYRIGFFGFPLGSDITVLDDIKVVDIEMSEKNKITIDNNKEQWDRDLRLIVPSPWFAPSQIRDKLVKK